MVTFSRYFQNTDQVELMPDIVACEDSTSIAAIYSGMLDTEVHPAFGRSNFFRIIKENQIAFIIADKPKFGSDLLKMQSFYNYLKY